MASLPSITAVNLTGGALFLDRLGLNVPASGSLELTLYSFVDEIRNDDSLYSFIDAGSIVLSGGNGNWTKGDSLKWFNVVPMEVRVPVRALADANVASLSGTTTIDSVALGVDDRVLLSNQSTGSENGVWVVKAGAWVRPQDFDTDESAASAIISVQEGATYANQVWQCTSDTGSDIIGTSSLSFAQISGGGGGSDTLQSAYNNGNTITTASSTPIAFTLTSGDFTVQGGGSVAFGNTTEVGSFSVFSAGTLTLQSRDTTSLDMQASDAAAKTLTIAASNAGAGSGNIAVTADDAIDVDAGGDVSINSTGGALNFGNDANTGTINIGTGAAARTLNIGNSTGATAINMDAGTGGVTIDATGSISIDGVGASNLTTDTGTLTLSTTTSGNVDITSVDAVNVSSGTTTDIQATGNVTIDSDTGSIGIGTDADDGAIDIGTGTTAGRVITIGNNTGTTGVAIEAGSGNVLIDSPLTTITGNLDVQGTTTTVDSETVLIADNHLYLNQNYEVASAQTGGLVVNYLPIASATAVSVGGFTAGVPAGANPTVNAAGGTFATGDFIQISGAANIENEGLYEVLSYADPVLTVRGVGTVGTVEDFTQNQFTTDTTVQGSIVRVNISVIRAGTDGIWETGIGSATALTFNDLLTGATVTLQNAYEGGNTITTSGAEGNVIVAGTESLQVTATNGLDVDTVADFDVTTFDVQMTGTNGFSIDGTAASNVSVTAGDLTLSTITSGSVLVDGTDGVEVNSSSGPINIGNDAVAQPINIGTGAAARTVTIGNNTGATGVVIDSGTEVVVIDGVAYYGTSAGLPTARTGGFNDGDQYFDTNLDMEMRYDAGRSKWLSVESMVLQWGRNGNTTTSQYYRTTDGRVMSSTLGFTMADAGTIVALGYSRTDTDAATFDVVEGGTSRATVPSAATSGSDRTLNGDFSAGGILAVQNQAGGNATSNVIGWVKVKFRGT
jgi:hypothetical protein